MLALSVQIVAPLAGLALFVAARALRRGCRVDLRRSVLIHAPVACAWEAVRRFPDLYARHGKARDFGALEDSELLAGDGERAGSLWRVRGSWDGAPYWTEVEIVRSAPRHEVALRLARDSLGTHRRLGGHEAALMLQAVDPRTTKLTWTLRARLRGPRILVARFLSAPRLNARLLDQGLRSIKFAVEAAYHEGAPEEAAGPERSAAPPAAPPMPPARPPESSL